MKKTTRYALFVLCSLSSIALIALTARVSGMSGMIDIFGISLNPTQVAGVLTAFRSVIAVLTVLFGKKIGLYVELTIILFGSVTVFITFLQGRVDGIPGVAHFIATVFLLIVVYTYVYAVDRNAEKLEELSANDSLTLIKNRRALSDVMDELILKNEQFFIVMITIKNFVNINNTLGRDYGDRVLLKVAYSMKNLKDEDEIIGRIGGADFAVILKGMTNRDRAEKRIEEYLDEISKPFKLDNVELMLECKASCAYYPKDALTREELFRQMDATFAMNRNNKDRRVFFFNQDVTDRVIEERRIEKRLVEAISRGLFHIVFQPQYRAENKHLRGFETLCRLEYPDGTPIASDKFIDVAERTNLIFKIDNWVLTQAVKRFRPLLSDKPELILSVNISANHFAVDGFAEFVENILKEYSFPGQNLEIEVTETAFANNMGKVVECLKRLDGLGVRIALDDFGTGYASLSYLSKLPISTLKVDKSFVDRIGTSEKDDEFIEVIISMGHILNMTVVAEGVENSNQKDFLKKWKTDVIQGYIWGKPMELEQAYMLD